MEIGTDEPARATTFLFSTRSRTAAADRDESEPSSTWNSLTGWQAIPPRALMSETHTCIPTRAGSRTLLTIPEKPPTCPMTTGEPGLVQPLAVGVPGIGAAAVAGVAPAAALLPLPAPLRAPDAAADVGAAPAVFPAEAGVAADGLAAPREVAAGDPPAEAPADGPAGADPSDAAADAPDAADSTEAPDAAVSEPAPSGAVAAPPKAPL